MKTPHKHAELIKAWADGAEIQYSEPFLGWLTVRNPSWDSNMVYRIKPESKPDFVEGLCLIYQGGIVNVDFAKPNLILTFDRETGALKSAEVL